MGLGLLPDLDQCTKPGVVWNLALHRDIDLKFGACCHAVCHLDDQDSFSLEKVRIGKYQALTACHQESATTLMLLPLFFCVAPAALGCLEGAPTWHYAVDRIYTMKTSTYRLYLLYIYIDISIYIYIRGLRIPFGSPISRYFAIFAVICTVWGTFKRYLALFGVIWPSVGGLKGVLGGLRSYLEAIFRDISRYLPLYVRSGALLSDIWRYLALFGPQ